MMPYDEAWSCWSTLMGSLRAMAMEMAMVIVPTGLAFFGAPAKGRLNLSRWSFDVT
jgi:hypothetical protein